jgi:hypothetical protein
VTTVPDEQKLPAPRFRLGRHIATNIYRDDEYMAHACHPQDAQLIVDALNRREREHA